MLLLSPRPQGEYTRSRLYDPGYDTKVLEVRDEVSGQNPIGKKLIGSAQWWDIALEWSDDGTIPVSTTVTS